MNDLPEFPATTKWMAHQFEILANRNYRSASTEERFISQAYRWYTKSQDKDYERFWNTTGRSLYYIMAHLESIWVSNTSELLANKEMQQGMRNAIEFEQQFMKSYMNKYDNVFENTLLAQLPAFLEYVQEYYDLSFSHDLDLTPYATNSEIINQFKSFLFRAPMNEPEDLYFKLYLLQSLYSANPELATWRVSKLWAKAAPPEVIKGANEAKANLLERINIEKELESQHWDRVKESLPKITGRVLASKGGNSN